jgi:hypothetical protein
MEAGLQRCIRLHLVSITALIRRSGMGSNVTRTVRTDQIISASPIGSRPFDDMDDLSAGFFAEGSRQELEGCYAEPRPAFRGSFDRLPRHRGPMFVLLALTLIPIGAGVAWRSGWQPLAQWRSWAASVIGSVSRNDSRGERPGTP